MYLEHKCLRNLNLFHIFQQTTYILHVCNIYLQRNKTQQISWQNGCLIKQDKQIEV